MEKKSIWRIAMTCGGIKDSWAQRRKTEKGLAQASEVIEDSTEYGRQLGVWEKDRGLKVGGGLKGGGERQN